MEAFDSDSEDEKYEKYEPIKKNNDEHTGNAQRRPADKAGRIKDEKGEGSGPHRSPSKSAYMSEQDLWKVITDIEMATLSSNPKSTELPSEYNLGRTICEKLNELEEQARIPSAKDARALKDSPERICIQYMRAMIDPAQIKKKINSEFPSKDFGAILNQVKHLCPDELDQYNMRLALRKYVLRNNTPRTSPEKSPARTSEKASSRTPEKPSTPHHHDRSTENIKIIFPATIDKFDMTKIKSSSELIGQEVPFVKTSWKRYNGYQVYADGGPKLFLHRDSLGFLKGHGELPKLIKGKLTAVETQTAADDNRYDLNGNEQFGIATLQFTTKG